MALLEWEPRSSSKGTAQQAAGLQLLIICEFFAEWRHSASLLIKRNHSQFLTARVLTHVILTNLWNNLEIETKRLVKQWTLNAFISPLPCDVTRQVSDKASVTLLHGIVGTDARCALHSLWDHDGNWCIQHSAAAGFRLFGIFHKKNWWPSNHRSHEKTILEGFFLLFTSTLSDAKPKYERSW